MNQSLPWFFVEVLPGPGGGAALDAREAKHALGSRRLGPGDEVVLFDGRGGLARAAIEPGPDRFALAARVAAIEAAPLPRPLIHLASALPKGDRAATMLGMAAQLGMTSFTPLVCERGVVEPGPNAAERWRRIMIEACKQSRRPFVPELHRPTSPADVVATDAAAAALIVCAHPGGRPVLDEISRHQRERITLIIGPEGGFTDDEVEAMTAAGAHMVDLGPGILRIETAAVIMVGAAVLAAGQALNDPQ